MYQYQADIYVSVASFLKEKKGKQLLCNDLCKKL